MSKRERCGPKPRREKARVAPRCASDQRPVEHVTLERVPDRVRKIHKPIGASVFFLDISGWLNICLYPGILNVDDLTFS